jgi:hypothetical protein
MSGSEVLLPNLRLKSRAMRVNPEGPGFAYELCKWPTSITAMTNKKRTTNRALDNPTRNMNEIVAATVLKCRINMAA